MSTIYDTAAYPSISLTLLSIPHFTPFLLTHSHHTSTNTMLRHILGVENVLFDYHTSLHDGPEVRLFESFGCGREIFAICLLWSLIRWMEGEGDLGENVWRWRVKRVLRERWTKKKGLREDCRKVEELLCEEECRGYCKWLEKSSPLKESTYKICS